MDDVLQNALKGCIALLEHAEPRSMRPAGWDSSAPVRLYVDAAGEPARIAAVIFIYGMSEYFATDVFSGQCEWL